MFAMHIIENDCWWIEEENVRASFLEVSEYGLYKILYFLPFISQLIDELEIEVGSIFHSC